jgi:uncharacterized membrane protein
MSSPASIKNHPIHPMLVGLPIGLWVFALVCDIFRLAGQGPAWSTAAIYCVAGGIVGAVLAAIPGLIDYFSIDEKEMGRIATFHMLLNLGAIIIFTLNLWLRFRLTEDTTLPLWLSLAGVTLIGWVARRGDGLRKRYGRPSRRRTSQKRKEVASCRMNIQSPSGDLPSPVATTTGFERLRPDLRPGTSRTA